MIDIQEPPTKMSMSTIDRCESLPFQFKNYIGTVILPKKPILSQTRAVTANSKLDANPRRSRALASGTRPGPLSL